MFLVDKNDDGTYWFCILTGYGEDVINADDYVEDNEIWTEWQHVKTTGELVTILGRIYITKNKCSRDEV